MISFVMTTRNDGYGGICEGVENFTMRRLQITLASIRRMFPSDEIIVVEWGDTGVEKFIEGFNINLIKLNPGNLTRLPFYEYITKDYGIKRARYDNIIACNPDNIFVGLEDIEFSDDIILRAMRLDIPRRYALLNNDDLIARALDNSFDVTHRWSSAGGDFCGFTKKTYYDLGGYLLSHSNWGIDTEFEERARRKRYSVVYPYWHYHVEHDNSVIEEEGRKTGFEPISRKDLESVDEYHCEAV